MDPINPGVDIMESVLQLLNDTVIQKIFLSGVVFVLSALLMMGIRKAIRTMKMNDEKKDIGRKWVFHFFLILYLFVLIRLWAYDILLRVFEGDVVNRILTSLILVIFFLSITFLIRRLLWTFALEREKRQQYLQWAVTLFSLIMIFVLVRLWAFENLFQFFRHAIVVKMFWSLLIFIIIRLARVFARRFINSLNIDIEKKHVYRKWTTYIGTLIFLLILIPVWAGSTRQWATVLSVMGAGVALALHEVLLNFAGWVYIMIRRPFKSGERIEMGGVRGDVIDIGTFQSTLLELGNWVDGDQSTGRVVHLPHGQIFRGPCYNYTKGFEFIWNEISAIITFESNWEKAREMLRDLGEEESKEVQEKVKRKIDRMAREYLIYFRKYTPIVYVKIEDSGVKLTLRYLTDAKQRRLGEDSITRKMLAGVNAAKDIQFAYPTYRITGSREGPPDSPSL